MIIAIAGPAGSGKTTLGRALARALALPLLDLDTLTNPLLEGLGSLLAGRHWNDSTLRPTIRPARYAALLAALSDQVDVGGGAVLVAPFTAELAGGAEWRQLVHAAGGAPTTVWLQASPGLLAERRAGRAADRDAHVVDAAAGAPPVVPHLVVDASWTTSVQVEHVLGQLTLRQARGAGDRNDDPTTAAPPHPRVLGSTTSPTPSPSPIGEPPMADFTGRTILVTGAGGGIGGAIVRQLVTAGADVLAAARTEDNLQALVAETGVTPLPFDLESEDEIRAAIEGRDIWGVVNCGGWGGEIATPQETDIDVFDKVMRINARGSLLVTKYASREMIRVGRGGSIVNVSSQASLVALAGHISYGSSKAALDNITRVSALELGPHQIRVNGVNPTVVMTPMSAWYWGRPEIEGPFLDQMPLGRWATEDEIAGPVVFLLSDAASMVSGVSLPIDGGYTAR